MLKISAKNFRSYPDLEWTLGDGLVLLDGVNRDTNGGNMVGKSSVCDAWAWARYGWIPRWSGPKGGNSDDVVMRGADHCVVHVTETFTSDKIEIIRERPAKLTVLKNGIQIKGMTQKDLDQLLGLDAYQFLVSVYLPQKRNRSFYWMTDAERTDLLSQISSLEALDKALEKAKAKKDSAQESITFNQGSISLLKDELTRLPLDLESAKTARHNNHLSAIKAKENLDRIKSQYVDETQALKQRLLDEMKAPETAFSEKDAILVKDISDINARISEVGYSLETLTMQPIDPSYEKQRNDANAQLKEVRDFNNKFSLMKRTNQECEVQIERASHLMETLKAGKCRTCLQPLPEWEIERHLEEQRSKIEGFKAQIQPGVPDHIDEKPYLQAVDRANLALAEQKINQGAGSIALQQQRTLLLTQLKAKQHERQSVLSDFNFAKQSLWAKHHKQTDELLKLVESVEQTCVRETHFYETADQRYQTILKRLSETQDKLSGCELKVTQAKKELDLAIDLIELFGPKGFRSVCYDGLVDRISERAGALLALMTENLYTTHLEQTSTDSKGNQKFVLNPVIIKEGRVVPKDDLSGGAEARASLAYDIAISEAISFNLPLLLDETLEGLDAVGKSEAMVLLEEISKHRPVVVIDHASEFKAQFTNVVRVIYEKGQSRLEVS